MSVSSKSIPYPRVFGFFKNSYPIPHHDVGRQDGQIEILKGVHIVKGPNPVERGLAPGRLHRKDTRTL